MYWYVSLLCEGLGREGWEEYLWFQTFIDKKEKISYDMLDKQKS